MLLIARGTDGLAETKAKIEVDTPGITVVAETLDLSDKPTELLEDLLRRVLNSLALRIQDFQQAVIVHNAATLGDVSKLYSQHDSIDDLREYWDINLTAVTLLNHVFLKHFSKENIKEKVVINITSICALQPFKSWSLYCAGL